MQRTNDPGVYEVQNLPELTRSAFLPYRHTFASTSVPETDDVPDIVVEKYPPGKFPTPAI